MVERKSRVNHIMRTRTQIKAIIAERLRREFPTDTVDVSDGYQNNIPVSPDEVWP